MKGKKHKSRRIYALLLFPMPPGMTSVDRIHYYQVGSRDPHDRDNPSPDGLSLVRKRFTALLAEHFLASLHQLPPSSLPKCLQLLASSLDSRDVQTCLNSDIAEGLLYSYACTTKGPAYGSPLYRDYVHVYVPAGSLLHTQDGWQPRGTNQACGRQVWAGFVTLSYGQTRTITPIWMVPGAARKDAKGWRFWLRMSPGGKAARVLINRMTKKTSQEHKVMPS